MIKSLLILFTIHCSLFTASAQTRDFTRWVNPFIGTGGHGHTFPGATVPFGMVQLSPDTRIDNWDGSSGYHYSDDIIYGFSHTHLSGTGIPDGCDILFMPTIGQPHFFAKEGDKAVNGYASRFSHANETAEPGYYSVKLDDDGIFAELTATERVGLHRYTFPKGQIPQLLLDINWRDKLLEGKFSVTPNRRGIQGYRQSASWAKTQKVYFVAEFSSEYEFMPTVQHKNGEIWTPEQFAKSDYFPIDPIKASFRFKNVRDRQLLVKVAISYVSIEGARKNLEAEIPGWDFDKVRSEAKAAWNKELGKIDVSGGTPEQTTNFYTALYHTMIQPNVFNDVDGRYLGHDRKIHQLPGYLNRKQAATQSPKGRNSSGSKGVDRNSTSESRNPEQYTVFSLWDTFRAAHPLYTIIDQKRTVDFINTFIRQYEQGGRLPVWELWGEETDTMIGYHAVSVIADAMAKGIKGFDYEKAYAGAKHSAELDHFGLAGYKKRGYISMEDENESVSRTLEYAYNDWCIMSMAATLYNMRSLNKVNSGPGDAEYLKKLESDIERYRTRARYFENLFDTKTGFFRPKKNGGFVEPFAPNEVTFGFTEGNSWQYSFFVPQDVTHLMTLMGGQQKFIAKLDELLTTDQKLGGREQADLTGLIGQYAHGNEPSHHITYLYDYAGEPWKTQKYVRFIMDNFYKNAPDGLIGNEDCGQMSAWYIMSAGGFYPVSPGSPVYAFGTPLFPEMRYKLENGKTFTIRAKNVSPKNSYVLNAKLNGALYKKAFITHDQIMSGGVLEFMMIDQPVATAFTQFPVSSLVSKTAAVPVIYGERTFGEKTQVTLSTASGDAKLYYRIDREGENAYPDTFRAYDGPFLITENSKVTAMARKLDGTRSLDTEAVFKRRPNDWTVKVFSGYSNQYTGGGENAIVDGIRGTVNFASGEWQGVQGKSYEAVIDLKRETEIKELGASFLQVAGPWIWMPSNIKFEISNNGSDWTQAADIKTDVPLTEMKPTIKEFRQTISPVKARYVRVRAYNIGKIPSWHLGAGGDPWIFVDEIFIN